MSKQSKDRAVEASDLNSSTGRLAVTLEGAVLTALVAALACMFYDKP